VRVANGGGVCASFHFLQPLLYTRAQGLTLVNLALDGRARCQRSLRSSQGGARNDLGLVRRHPHSSVRHRSVGAWYGAEANGRRCCALGALHLVKEPSRTAGIICTKTQMEILRPKR